MHTLYSQYMARDGTLCRCGSPCKYHEEDTFGPKNLWCEVEDEHGNRGSKYCCATTCQKAAWYNLQHRDLNICSAGNYLVSINVECKKGVKCYNNDYSPPCNVLWKA